MKQLKREEFANLVKGMKAVYAQPSFIADKYAFETWYYLLQDIPYKQLNVAVQIHLQSSRFPPTIAELREAVAKLTPKETEISELEAWAIVRQALSRSGYYSEEEFEKLPETVKKAVGHHENLKEWSQMEVDTVESVIQSQFLRSYRAALFRRDEMNKLSPAIRQALEDRRQEHKAITGNTIA